MFSHNSESSTASTETASCIIKYLQAEVVLHECVIIVLARDAEKKNSFGKIQIWYLPQINVGHGKGKKS